jgi:diacylglycerol kinase (ATP)
MTAAWVVAVNPTAGGGRGARWGLRTVTALRDRGHEVQVVVGTTAADAERRVERVVAGGARALVVVGGDGMVHLGVNVAASTGVPLGVVPAGSGNDFARALGLGGLDPASAVAVMVRADAAGGVDIDLGRVNGGPDGQRYFGCVLSTGFDAAVNARANQMHGPGGRARYPVAMLAELGAFRPIPLTVTVDGVRHQHDAMLVAIGNAPSYGGGMRICPAASLSDGLFTVTVVDEMSVPELLRLFPRVYRGTHVQHSKANVYVGRGVDVHFRDGTGPDGSSDMPVFADGEQIGSGSVSASVIPHALRVLVPGLP